MKNVVKQRINYLRGSMMHNPLFITPSTFLSPPTRTKSGCIGLHSTESKRMLDEDIVIVRQTPKLGKQNVD